MAGLGRFFGATIPPGTTGGPLSVGADGLFRSADLKARTIRVGTYFETRGGEAGFRDQVYKVAADVEVRGEKGEALKLADLKQGTPVKLTRRAKLTMKASGETEITYLSPVIKIKVASPNAFPFAGSTEKRDGRK